MSGSDAEKLDFERRKQSNDDERLRLERSFSKKWAPIVSAVLIPLAIGSATFVLSAQQFIQSEKDNRIKQGSLCLDYFHKFDTDTTYTSLNPAQRTATLETLQTIFTDFPECLNLHARAIQNSYLASTGVNGVSNAETLAELNKISARIYGLTQKPAMPVLPSAGVRSDYQIYLHFDNEVDRARVQQIADGLAVKGWRMRPIQHVLLANFGDVQAKDGDVRYYKTDEAPDAELLAKDIASISSTLPGSRTIDLAPSYIGKTYPNLPSGVMEVWIAAY